MIEPEKKDVKDIEVVDETTIESKSEPSTESYKAVQEEQEEELSKTDDIKNISIAENANLPFVTSDVDFDKSIAFITAIDKSLQSIQRIASTIMKSKLCPLKTESDIVNATITGIQLGLPFMVAINNIYPINGKTTMSTHLHRALLIKHRIEFTKIYDCEPMYVYAAAKKEGDKLVPVFDDKKQPSILGVFTQDNPPKVPHFKGNNPVDYITKYVFSRKVRNSLGNPVEYKSVGSFTLSEAKTAGLTDKDNWKNYLNRMLDARAFIFGSREVASDITLGIPSLNEIADIENVSYTINDSLEERLS